MVVCTSGNAIVLKDSGNMITYKARCPVCGYVETQEHLCSVSHTATLVSGSVCYKCKKTLGSFKFERR